MKKPFSRRKKERTPKDVWIFAEVVRGRLSPTAFELLAIGRILANDLNQKLCAVLMGKRVKKFAKTLIAHGADVVYIVDSRKLDNFIDDNFAYALVDLVNKYHPEKLILPATSMGRGLSAKTAVLLGTGLTADATQLSINKENGQLYATRPTFGGNLMATITCPEKRPEMCSVRPMAYPKAGLLKKRKGKIIKKSFEVKKHFSPTRFISFIKADSDLPDITEAEIIVSGGRGMKNKEGFALITELAKLLGGAVGASRAAVDAGWVNYRHQIGLTSRTVKPKIYIACGISGAVQHIAGMSSSDKIIAINKDKDAPIMKIADYTLEGDVFDILPEMIKELKK